MVKQITLILSIWLLSFIMSSVFLIFKDNNNHFYFYILVSMIFSSLNSILSYLIIRDFSMGVNWKINEKEENDFYENLNDSATNDKNSSPFDKYIDKFEKIIIFHKSLAGGINCLVFLSNLPFTHLCVLYDQ